MPSDMAERDIAKWPVWDQCAVYSVPVLDVTTLSPSVEDLLATVEGNMLENASGQRAPLDLRVRKFQSPHVSVPR